ncbi:MAG: hypothetical protein ACTSPQ_18570 [Candidatus Helarchaeota archaeon]
MANSIYFTTENLQKFKNIKNVEQFNDDERYLVYYILKLKKMNPVFNNFEIFLSFEHNKSAFYVENNKIFFQISPTFTFDRIKFELYKIAYLIKYPIARSIYGFWPGFYNYDNIKSQFFYLMGIISLLTFSYVFSMTQIGLILNVTMIIIFLIYIIFVINLFIMIINISINSYCYNETCNNKAKGRYCLNCELYLRKNPFVLLGVPKIIIDDPLREIELEFELFLKLIISETNFIKKYMRIIINFDLYNRYSLVDPFSINMTLAKNSDIEKMLIAIFNLDFYLAQRYSRDYNLNFVNFNEISNLSNNKTITFIRKNEEIYNLIITLSKLNLKYPHLIENYEFDQNDSLIDKIKKIGLLKFRKLAEIDPDFTQKLLKELNNPEFSKLIKNN